MTFLNPMMLWSLTALIPLAAVYLLKIRPARKNTSTYFLWDELFEKKKATTLFRRLRDLFSLLLLALAFALICMSLADPMWEDTERNKDLILLIDNSASMSAMEDGQTRLEQATDTANEIIRSLPAGRRAAIFTVSRNLESVVNLTDNQRVLTKGLESISETDLALKTSCLQPLVQHPDQLKNRRLILISDGCFKEIDKLPAAIELSKVGSPQGNIGISAFDLRRIPGEGHPLGLYFQLVSSFPEKVSADVILAYETIDQVRRVIPVTLEPGISPPEIFTVPNAESGTWILQVEYKDALAKDNIAHAVVPELKPIRVQVAGAQDRFFLETCIRAFRDAAINMVEVEDNPDIVLVSGQAHPENYKEGSNLVVLNPQGSSPLWKRLSPDGNAAVLKVSHKEHPAVRYCSLDGLALSGVRELQAPEHSVVLVETEQGTPTVYKLPTSSGQAYVINIDPTKSEFFLTTHFPILLYSVSVEMMNRDGEPVANYRPGSVIDAGVSEDTSYEITAPDQSKTTIDTSYFGPVDQLGIYHCKHRDGERSFACSVIGQAESALNNDLVKHTAGALSKGYPLKVIFLIAALLLFVIESMLYHKRKVG